MDAGYVYVISNEWFNTRYDHTEGPGIPLLKIGHSYEPIRRSLDGKRAFRNKTFLPGPFQVEFAIYCENYIEVEKYLHKLFASYRTAIEGYGTEWFTVEKEKIKVVLEGMVIANPRNKWWSEAISNFEEDNNLGVESKEQETDEIPKKIKKKSKIKKKREEERLEMENMGWVVIEKIYGSESKKPGQKYLRFKSPIIGKTKGRVFVSHKQAYEAFLSSQREE